MPVDPSKKPASSTQKSSAAASNRLNPAHINWEKFDSEISSGIQMLHKKALSRSEASKILYELNKLSKDDAPKAQKGALSNLGLSTPALKTLKSNNQISESRQVGKTWKADSYAIFSKRNDDLLKVDRAVEDLHQAGEFGDMRSELDAIRKLESLISKYTKAHPASRSKAVSKLESEVKERSEILFELAANIQKHAEYHVDHAYIQFADSLESGTRNQQIEARRELVAALDAHAPFIQDNSGKHHTAVIHTVLDQHPEDRLQSTDSAIDSTDSHVIDWDIPREPDVEKAFTPDPTFQRSAVDFLETREKARETLKTDTSVKPAEKEIPRVSLPAKDKLVILQIRRDLRGSIAQIPISAARRRPENIFSSKKGLTAESRQKIRARFLDAYKTDITLFSKMLKEKTVAHQKTCAQIQGSGDLTSRVDTQIDAENLHFHQECTTDIFQLLITLKPTATYIATNIQDVLKEKGYSPLSAHLTATESVKDILIDQLLKPIYESVQKTSRFTVDQENIFNRLTQFTWALFLPVASTINDPTSQTEKSIAIHHFQKQAQDYWKGL